MSRCLTVLASGFGRSPCLIVFAKSWCLDVRVLFNERLFSRVLEVDFDFGDLDFDLELDFEEICKSANDNLSIIYYK